MHEIERLDTEWRNNQSPDINAANLQLHTDKINEVIEGMEELELEFAELPSIQDLNKTVEEVKAVDANVNKNALKAEGFAVGEQNGAEVDKNSEYYHNNAKWYSELAMSGTPEGYEQLVQEVDNIKRESSVFYGYGTNLNLVTEAGGIRLGSILGKSVVEGGEIKSVETINIINHNKNFIPYPYASQRKDSQDAHFEVLPNGGVHVWGNFKSDIAFDFANNFKLKVGSYVVSGVPKNSKVMMRVINTRGQNWAQISDGGIAKKTITADVEIRSVQIFVQSAGEVDTVVYPQIESGDTLTSFEPQISNPVSIAVPGGLRSVNDVADRLILSDDGKWIIERYTKKEIYNGQTITTDWISSTGSLTTGATVVYVTDKAEEILPDQEDAYRLLSFTDKTYIGTEEGLATFNVEFGKSVGVALGLRGDNAFGLADTKQQKLNDSQMAAVDSGITSTKVSTYDSTVTEVGTLSDEVEELSEEVTDINSNLSQFNATGRTLELDTEVGGIVVNEVVGNSEQGANPSPTNPQPIHSSGDGGGIRVELNNINLLVPTLESTTQNGVTITRNADNTYTLNGKATISFRFYLEGMDYKIYNGTYKLLGCPSGGSSTTYQLNMQSKGNNPNIVDNGSGANFEPISGEEYRSAIFCYGGYIFNNVTFKPMITKDLDVTDYEPNSHKSIFIPLAEPLYGKDNVHDRIIRKDNKWFVERHFKSADMGTLSWIYDTASSAFATTLQGIKNVSVSTVAKIMCPKFVAIAWNGSWDVNTMAYFNTRGYVGFSARAFNRDVSTLISAVTGDIIIWELENPVYEEITDQTALYLLESYADKTYISTSDGLAELNVNYGKSDAIASGMSGINALDVAENLNGKLTFPLKVFRAEVTQTSSSVASDVYFDLPSGVDDSYKVVGSCETVSADKGFTWTNEPMFQITSNKLRIRFKASLSQKYTFTVMFMPYGGALSASS